MTRGAPAGWTQRGRPSTLAPRWLGFAVQLGLSYGIGLMALLAAGDMALGVVRAPRGLREPASLLRVLPARVNDLGPYQLAPVFAAREWDAIRGGGVRMEVYRPAEVTLADDGTRRRVLAAQVSRGFLPLAGAALFGGRFLAEDDGGSAVLLSERMARELFGQAQTAVGAAIRVDGRTATVVGVLGRGFAGVDRELVDAWQLLDGGAHRRGVEEFALSGVVRLEEGASAQVVAERVGAILAAAGARVRSVRLAPLAEDRLGGAGVASRALPFALMLSGAVVALAIANCWLLMTGWGMVRSADLRIRHVVGASPWRLGLSVAGVPLATLVFTTPVVALLAPRMTRALSWLGADVEQYRSALAVEAVVGAALALIGAAVALALLTRRAVGRLVCNRRPAGFGGRSRARGLVVAAYVGVVSSIAIGSVPVVSANLAVARVRPGFNPTNAVVAAVVIDGGAGAPTLERIRAAVLALERLPYVTAAGASGSAPFRAVSTGTVARGAGGFRPTTAHIYEVVGDVPGALGVETKRGELGPTARGWAGVVVTQALAAQWGATPGGCVYVDGDVCSPVLAVVSDMNSIALGEPPFPTVFVPMRDGPTSGRVYFLVRTSHRLTGKELGEVEAAVVTALPPASVRVERLEAVMREQTAPLRAVQAMCAVLFALGAGLGAIGIRAGMRLSVATRLRELGIRAALGASRVRLVASVLEESAIAGGVAGALGMAIGVLAAHALATVIVGVSRTHAVWQVAIGLAMPALVVAASAVSAFRATRVESGALLSDWRGQV